MTRLLILGLIGFVVGLMVSGSVAVVRGLDALEPLTEEVADGGDAELEDDGGEGGLTEIDQLALDSPEDPAVAQPDIPVVGGPELSAAVGVDDAEMDDGSERLARIFGAMRPADAARVLEKLNDSEIKSIVRHLPDRKAAAILGHFDSARAAALSRSVIGQGSI